MVMNFILNEVADVSLISGHRGELEQNELVDLGRSQVRYPNSKHNAYPSRAVDFTPYPYPTTDLDLYAGLAYVAGAAKVFASSHGFNIRWGGDWNENGSVVDNNFDDLFHLEIN